MQLLIKNGIVSGYAPDHINLKHIKSLDYDIVYYDGIVDIMDPDPRTPEEKAMEYQDKRRLAYPEIGDQLDMMYWDKVNGTDTWQRAIAAVKARYPKP